MSLAIRRSENEVLLVGFRSAPHWQVGRGWSSWLLVGRLEGKGNGMSGRGPNSQRFLLPQPCIYIQAAHCRM